MYGSYKLLKTVRFFGPPCICPEAEMSTLRLRPRVDISTLGTI